MSTASSDIASFGPQVESAAKSLKLEGWSKFVAGFHYWWNRSGSTDSEKASSLFQNFTDAMKRAGDSTAAQGKIISKYASILKYLEVTCPSPRLAEPVKPPHAAIGGAITRLDDTVYQLFLNRLTPSVGTLLEAKAALGLDTSTPVAVRRAASTPPGGEEPIGFSQSVSRLIAVPMAQAEAGVKRAATSAPGMSGIDLSQRGSSATPRLAAEEEEEESMANTPLGGSSPAPFIDPQIAAALQSGKGDPPPPPPLPAIVPVEAAKASRPSGLLAEIQAKHQLHHITRDDELPPEELAAKNKEKKAEPIGGSKEVSSDLAAAAVAEQAKRKRAPVEVPKTAIHFDRFANAQQFIDALNSENADFKAIADVLKTKEAIKGQVLKRASDLKEGVPEKLYEALGEMPKVPARGVPEKEALPPGTAAEVRSQQRRRREVYTKPAPARSFNSIDEIIEELNKDKPDYDAIVAKIIEAPQFKEQIKKKGAAVTKPGHFDELQKRLEPKP